MTLRYGWGGEVPGGTAGQTNYASYSYTNNRRDGFTYDGAGNLTNDIGQNFAYDAAGRQTKAWFNGGYYLWQDYSGDGLRAKKNDNGWVVYYLRSTVLGGQVVAEVANWGSGYGWFRGYVYAGQQLIALQAAGIYWTHQDPVTKSQRVTNATGDVVTGIELDPWGSDTNRSWNHYWESRRFTSWERDGNASDDAMFRRYNRWQARFDQPDPYDGSYDMSDPQSLNRYAYVQNDPVNHTDSTGLQEDGDLQVYGAGGGGGADIDYAFWGSRIADLPGFGTTWGSLSGLAEWEHGQRVQNTLDAVAATSAARRGGWATVAALMNGDPTLVLEYAVPFGLLAQNGNQLKQFAEQLVNNIPGARLETRSGRYVVVFSGSYEEVVDQLHKAGYKSGALPPYNNPLDHSGGKEFRTTSTPGFHFMVLYPHYRVTWGPPQNRGELTPYYARLPGPTMAVHLHVDPNNPTSGFGGFFRHAIDFLLRR